MFTAVAIALVAISVPPGASPLNHNQPAHGGDPVVRVFEQRPIDDYRRAAWCRYCAVLDIYWAEYRASGSTPAAFDLYRQKAKAAKRAYVYQDPYYVAVPDYRPALDPRTLPIGGGDDCE